MQSVIAAGWYVAPNGDCVKVFQSYGGAWACVIAPPGSNRVSVQELTHGFWRTLRP